MNVTIRRIGPGDEALFDRIVAGVFDAPIDPSRLTTYLAESNNLMLLAVAEDGSVVGQCAGVIHCHPDKPTELCVDEVGVAPRFRRLGLGVRMMTEISALGRSVGCTAIWVCAEPHNEQARALYRRYAEPETVLIFQWDL